MDMNTKGDGAASDQELASNELPEGAPNEEASCPILHDVTLLPIRYGRVEVEPEEYDSGVPYTLRSRPLGYRLLRDGFIYIYNENESALYEYPYIDDCVIGGPIKYPNDHVIHTCFSTITWTVRKKAQISNSLKERSRYMQRIDLSVASTCQSGENLLTIDDAKKWVAEFSEEYRPEDIANSFKEETEPYVWENDAPKFSKTRIGKLSDRQGISSLEECVCLVLRDDVGVMLDLADHQDEVIGWIKRWTSSDDNERKYLTGSIIESLSKVDILAFEKILRDSEHQGVQEMLEDWEQLDPEEQADFRSELVELLNNQSKEQVPEFRDENLPEEAIQYIRDNLDTGQSYYGGTGLEEARTRNLDRWYAKTFFKSSDTKFVDQHIESIVDLQDMRRRQLFDILEAGVNSSRGLGSRGINDLIIRDTEDDERGLDLYMEEERIRLQRWNGLLESISDDRADMLANNRYHNSTWYFDQWDDEQAESLCVLTYECLRDICRSDNAVKRVMAWMKRNPQYSHPFFHTLSLNEQDPGLDPLKTYLELSSTGYQLITHSKDLADKLNRAEENRLRDISNITESIYEKIALINDVWAPAITMGLSKEVAELYHAIGQREMPSLKHAFRDLDFFFKGSMLRAVKEGKVEFVLNTPEEFETFKKNFKKLIELSEEATRLKAEYNDDQSWKKGNDNKSRKELAERREKLNEFKEVRKNHRSVARLVAAALSPVIEDTEGLRVAIADSGHAGIIVKSRDATNGELAGGLDEVRNGNMNHLKSWKIGDHLGAAIFLAQLATLMQAGKELLNNQDTATDEVNRNEIYVSFASTASSGFMLAQGLKDAALNTRIRSLSRNLDNKAVTQSSIKLGKMHTYLGIVGYGSGFVASIYSFLESASKWEAAVRSGNSQKQAGAALSMFGSAGMVPVNGVGAVVSAYKGLSVAFSIDRVSAWGLSGRALSRLYVGLGVFSLAFTVIDLAGTWIYNYHNLSALDRWMLATPWGSEPKKRLDLTLEEFETRLTSIADSPYVAFAYRSGEKNIYKLVFPSIDESGLRNKLAGLPNHKVAVSPWRISTVPSRAHLLVWSECKSDFFSNLHFGVESDSLELIFDFKNGLEDDRRNWNLGLFVKVSTLHGNGVYYDQEFFFEVRRGSTGRWDPHLDIYQSELSGFDMSRIEWVSIEDPFIGEELYSV